MIIREVNQFVRGRRMRIGDIFTLILAAISMVLVLGGCNPSEVEITGSGNLITKTYDLQNFSRVELSRAFNAEITQSDDFSVSITVDDNIIDFLVVQKSGSILKIGFKSGRNYLDITNRADIKMPAISGIVLRDSSRASVSGFASAENLDIVLANASHFSLKDIITTEGLVIRASDASSIDIKQIKSGEFEIQASGSSKVMGILVADSGNIKISGGGTVDLDGEVAYVRLVVTGSGKASLEDLFMQDGDVALSGSAIATINVSGRLDVSASDASHLTYLGNPTLGNIELSDAASVSRQ